jgi:hypothetical protein
MDISSNPTSNFVSKAQLKAAKLMQKTLFAQLVILAINSIIPSVSVAKLLVVAPVSKTSRLVKPVSIFISLTQLSKLVIAAVKTKTATNA